MATIDAKEKSQKDNEASKLFKSADGWFLTECSVSRLNQFKKKFRPCIIAGMKTHAVKIVPDGHLREYWASVKTGVLFDTKTRQSMGGKLRIKWGHK